MNDRAISTRCGASDTAQASDGAAAFGDFANVTCPGCVANVSSSTGLQGQITGVNQPSMSRMPA